MKSNFISKKTIETESPIEFVIYGPIGIENGIIIKSSNAPLDLIGFAIEPEFKRDANQNTSNLLIFSLFSGRNKYQWVKVRANPGNVSSFSISTDQRDSELFFCWSGHANLKRREMIRGILLRYSYDLLRAIQANDVDLAINSIAPIVYLCKQANEREMYLLRFYVLFIIFYVVLIAVTLLYLTSIRRF